MVGRLTPQGSKACKVASACPSKVESRPGARPKSRPAGGSYGSDSVLPALPVAGVHQHRLQPQLAAADAGDIAAGAGTDDQDFGSQGPDQAILDV